ncbi:MAG: GGDEF domain-containing protein [Myxococcales bacterium]|nr:GGDEF domain-containing protein [Myxococcales bacterium]
MGSGRSPLIAVGALLVVLGVGTGWLVDSAFELDRARRSTRDLTKLATARATLERELAGRVQGLRLLATDPDLLAHGADHRAEVEAHLLAAMWLKPQVDHLRWITPDGMEAVRVNQGPDGPRAVPAVELQMKRDRPYLAPMLALRAGEAYVSPVEPNVEHGQVERPLKPVLRFAVPAGIGTAADDGVLVKNVRIDALLARLAEDLALPRAGFHMLSTDGAWIYPQAAGEAGLPAGAPADRFDRRHPEAWATMRGQTHGTFSTAAGDFAFVWLRPVRCVERLSPQSAPGWVLVLLEPHGSVRERWWLIATPRLLASTALGALGLALILLWARARARLRQVGRAQQRAVAAVEAAAGGLLVVDPRGAVELANASLRALGDPVRLMGALPPEAWGAGGWSGEIELAEDRERRCLLASWTPVVDEGRPLGHVGTFTDISRRKRRERLLAALAHTDALTGLANRAALAAALEGALAEARAQGDRFGVVMLDLDAFKPVNDTHGHAAGDFVLKTVAERLQAQVRRFDVVARLGGDEFVLLIDKVRAQAALDRVVASLVAVVAEPIALPSGMVVQVSASAGALLGGAESTVDGLLAAVDRAMYRDKGLRREASRAEAEEA